MSPVPSVWPTFSYRDPDAALRFLVDVFGFTERAVYRDGGAIAHAELTWTGPDGTVGGVMFGPVHQASVALGGVHVVVDDPDARYDRAVAAGAEVVREIEDTDFGSRQFVVRDPEGALWSFGTWYER